MNVFESGQDWKIAALKTNIHVHFLFVGDIMNLKYMEIAFSYAKKAYLNNEVPVGAVIVKDNEIISFGFNCKEEKKSIFEHAELIAIKLAEEKIDNWRLDNCDLYVTLDPCPMCASAIKQSRISNVYSALSNSKENSFIITKIFECDKTNPAVNFISNIDSNRSKKMLNSFFEKQRKK